MSPESLEQNNNQSENLNQTEKKYLDIERGDIQHPQSNNSDQNQPNNSTSNNSQPTKPQTRKSTAADPVELFKNIISGGFIPSKAQIYNSNKYLKSSNDSSNKWFAIFLRSKIKQKRAKDAKAKK